MTMWHIRSVDVACAFSILAIIGLILGAAAFVNIHKDPASEIASELDRNGGVIYWSDGGTEVSHRVTHSVAYSDGVITEYATVWKDGGIIMEDVFHVSMEDVVRIVIDGKAS